MLMLKWNFYTSANYINIFRILCLEFIPSPLSKHCLILTCFIKSLISRNYLHTILKKTFLCQFSSSLVCFVSIEHVFCTLDQELSLPLNNIIFLTLPVDIVSHIVCPVYMSDIVILSTHLMEKSIFII